MSKGERISRLVEQLSSEHPPTEGTEIHNHPNFRAFFHCWNEQLYYEAHDVLEQLWLKTSSTDADFFKGLIQSAGGFVHLQKQFQHPSHPKHGRRLHPAVRLFRLAGKHLAPYEPVQHALDVKSLRELLQQCIDQIVASDFRQNPWSPETAPKLELTR
jgi:predicted metal-dependent hydrolase